jgi:hypothetical protein
MHTTKKRKVHGIQTLFLAKRIYKETNLFTIEVPPFCKYEYTLAPAVLPLLEARLESLLLYGSEACCRLVLNAKR